METTIWNLTFKEVSFKGVMWIKLADIRVQFCLSLNTDMKLWVLWLNIRTGAIPVTCPIYVWCIVLHWQSYSYGRPFQSLFLLLNVTLALSYVTLYLELHLPFVWNCFGYHSWVVRLNGLRWNTFFRRFSWMKHVQNKYIPYLNIFTKKP